MESFNKFVRRLIEDIEIALRLQINMDETPIYFDLVSTKTIAQKGVKTVKRRSTGCERRHVTVVIAIAANESILKMGTWLRYQGDAHLCFSHLM